MFSNLEGNHSLPHRVRGRRNYKVFWLDSFGGWVCGEGVFLLYLPSVQELDNPVGLCGLLLVVRHHDDGAAVLAVQLMQ